MAFVVGKTREAANTTTGNQSFTITWADGGNHTPTAIEVRVSPATADNTAVDHAQISTGASDGTNQWARTFNHQSGVADSNSDDYLTDAAVVAILASDGSGVDAIATVDSFSLNTVVLNWTNAPSAAYLVHIVAYAGTTAAVVGITQPSTTDTGTVDVTTLGVPANYVYANGTSQNSQANETITTNGGISHGVFTYDGTTGRQIHNSFGQRNSQASSALSYRWSNNYTVAELRNGGQIIDGTFAFSTHANGFTITTRTIGAFGVQSHALGYLALALPSGVRAYAGTIQTPTSTGTLQVTDPGFTPQAVTIMGGYSNEIAGSATDDNDKETGSPDADNLFIGTAISSGNQHAITVTNQANAATMDTQNLSVSHVAQVVTDSGTVRIVADLQSFDANSGFTLDFPTTVATVRNWVYVAFEDDSAGGGTTLAPDDEAVATSLDNTTISQTHILATDDESVATSLDNATIAQTHILAPNDASVATSLDNGTISQNNILVPSDASVATSIDAGTISQTHVLVPQDASVATSLDNTTIESEGVLNPDDISVGTSADNGTISQTHILAPDDMSVATREDAATISQTHILVPDDATLATSLDNTTVSSEAVLVPGDMAVASSIDAATIVQTHVLSPQDVIAATTADNGSITQNHILVPQDMTSALTIENTILLLFLLKEIAFIGRKPIGVELSGNKTVNIEITGTIG